METIKINNTILEYNKVIYIDSVNGNDETGEGTKETPYQTLQKAMQNVTYNNQEAIYLKEGFYTVDAIHDMFDCKGVDFIGKGKNTIIEIYRNKNISGQYINGKIHNNFYDIIFTINDAFRTNSVAPDSGLYVLGTDSPSSVKYNFGVYNCIFDIKGQSMSRILGLDGTKDGGINGDFTVEKCEFVNTSFKTNGVPAITLLSSQNNLDYKMINCSTDANSFVNPSGGDYKNPSESTNLVSVVYGDNYYITNTDWRSIGTGLNPDGGQANIGVYGGEFSWEFPSYLIQDNTSIKTITDNGLEIIGQTPVTKEMFDEYGVNLSEFIGSINKTVNMDYKQDLGDKKIYGYKLVGYSDISKLEIGNVTIDPLTLIPKLTSNNSNPPIVVSASSYSGSDLPYKAVDGIDPNGNNRPFWYQCTDTNSWWKIDFGEGNEKVVMRIMLKAMSVSNGGGPHGSIKNWRLLASNDDVNYIELLSEIHPNNSDKVYYDVLNKYWYRFYKILIVDSYYSTKNTGILELQMYGYGYTLLPLIIKSNNKYYTYNGEWVEVELTEENFRIDFDNLTSYIDNVNLPMEYVEDLDGGKLYRKTINKRRNIQQIEVI